MKMMGMPGLPSAQLAVSEMGLPLTAEEFLSRAKEHKQELFPHCNIMPGLINLCHHIIEIIFGQIIDHNALVTLFHNIFLTPPP